MSELDGYEMLTINVRRLTELKRMPLTVLADRAGISRRELFAVMAGEVDPDVEWIRRLAEALGVTMADLFLVEEYSKPL